MSWQAAVVNRLLRKFVKQRHQRLDLTHQRILASRRRGLWCSRWLIRPIRGTRIQRVDTGQVRGEWVRAPSAREHRIIYFVHGGAFVIGRAANYRHLISRLSAAARACVFSVDYRLAPEHPFPAALTDVAHGWRWLERQRPRASRVAIAGDSAGGGLALSLLLDLKREGHPMPAAFAAMSPWVDLTLSGGSVRLHRETDPYVAGELLPEVVDFYLQGADPEDFRASPLFGDLESLPPILIHASDDEILLDDSLRLAARAREAGVEASIKLWPRLPHVFHLFSRVLPEGRVALSELGEFMERHWLDEPSNSRPSPSDCAGKPNSECRTALADQEPAGSPVAEKTGSRGESE